MADFILDDENNYQHMRPASFNGYVARDFEQTPYGAIPGVPEAEVKLIRMEEWPDRIADLERTGTNLKHRWLDSPIGILDQGDYPFCHGFAAVESILIQMVKQGLPYVALSPSSVAAPVTGFRKAGAWIGKDLQQIVKVGAAPALLIPMLTHSRSDFPPGWEKEAAKFRVTEYAELRPRDFEQHGSALLQNIAVSVGQSHWSHAVLHLVLRDMNPGLAATDHNRYGVEFPNSWGKRWGNQGWAVQVGSKKFADEAYMSKQVIV